MSTKRRIKKKNLSIFIIILLIILIPFGLYYYDNTKVSRSLKKLSYNKEVIPLIIKEKIDKYLIDNKIYSKTLEMALLDDLYEDDLLEEYIDFEYKDYDNYIKQLNTLFEIGYDKETNEIIFDKLNEDDINTLIKQKDIINNIDKYIEADYFRMDNLNRYLNYKNKNNDYDYNKVVIDVNMYLDYPYYEHDIKVTNPDDLLVIVNKYYKLSGTFEPKKLVKIDTKYRDNWERLVVPIVKENFEKMADDMSKLGLSIKVTSAYRAYDVQDQLYKENVIKLGKKQADSVSARAGYSEHQTGLAVDVKNALNDYKFFKDSEEYKWMRDNAHKYGFILRYPEDKTDITGYNFESWHYRYVGKEVAKIIHDNDLTFDEYYAIYIDKKKTD